MLSKVVPIFMIILLLSTSLYAEADSNENETKDSLLKNAVETVTDVATEVLETPSKLVKEVLEFALNPIVVTPWGTEEYAYNVSKNVSVITEEDIKYSNENTLPGLLQNQPGVVTSELLGNPKAANVDIRGFGETSVSNVLVLMNGRRTNQIDMSGVDWAQIDVNTIERIEVVRGASSVLYGDNATGGVINIITKKGKSAQPEVKIGSALGSNMYHTEYGTFQGYHDILDYFFSYKHRDEDGYRENNSFKANNWFGEVSLHPMDSFDFTTSAGYHKDEYGQPGSLRQAELEREGRRGTTHPDDIARTEDVFITGVPEIRIETGPHNLTAQVHGTYRYRKTMALNIWGPAWQLQTNHKTSSGDLRPKLQIDSLLCDENIDNTLVIGTDHFVATQNILSGNILTGRDNVDVSKRTCALYFHDNIELFDRFIFSGGYRYEWAKYKFEQKGQLTDNDRIKLNEWVFELGGGYKYNPSSQIYANWSRSYRYPATDEYYMATFIDWFGNPGGGLNRQIRQQVGHNFEVGIKDNSLEWLTVNADYFYIDTKHEIYYEPATFMNTNYSPRTKRYGFDIEAKANLFEGRLIPHINYTWQRARFDGGPYDNNDIPFVSDNQLSCGIRTTPLKNLTWNISLDYVGSKFMISDQRNLVNKLNSYMTVDTKLTYSLGYFTIFGAINNIFNRRYSTYGVTNAIGSDVTYYPHAERTFEIGGTLEF